MLLFYLRKTEKKRKDAKGIKVQLIYKPSLEANLRMSKALSMLLDEKDILEYFQKEHKSTVSKLKMPLNILTITDQKNA